MLKPKAVTLYRPVWLQLKARGYDVIPLFEGKAHPPKGWPTMPNRPEDIAQWHGRAAAIRMFGGEVLVIDLDIRIESVRDAVLAMFERRWPEFMARCLRRHSGAVKLALIGRCKTDLRTMNTHSYYPDPENLDKAQKNQVELFTGNSRRYVGVHGLHSVENGIERHYGYHGPSIVDTGAETLAEFPAADLGAMLDACEEVMAACGLHAARPDRASGGDTVVYDLLPDMVFRLSDGVELTLDALEDLVEREGRQAGYATIFDPKADSPDRVKANLARGGLALWDTKTETSHRWASAKPADPDAFAGVLNDILEEHGEAPPPPLPNWRERTKGGVKASLHNARLAISALGFRCSLDTFHNKMFLGQAGPPLAPFCGEVTDAAVMGLRVMLSDAFGIDFGETHVRDAVVGLANEARFDPVCDMLAEAEANWDGVRRLDRAAVDIFRGEDTPLNCQCVVKTLVAAVARARNPGCKFDTILTFEAPEGWNKSSTWAVLAGEGNFSDERIIGKDSREVVEQLAGVWIHENADLAGMYKSEVETVKAYASRVEDRARPAYGHFLVAQPRHSIEVGTTNSDVYLQSQTGNRRFWPMRLTAPIDLGQVRSLRLQLWGEAAALQSAGESLVLDPSLWGAAAIEQDERRVRDAWEDDLADLSVVAGSDALAGLGIVGNGVVEVVGDEERVSVKVIFDHVLRIPPAQRDDRHTKRLANCMRVLGWSRGRFRIGGENVRGYHRKVKGI